MPARYVCGEEGRRRAVRDPAVDLNGIDFLEVSDDQRRLSVHFLKTPVPGPIQRDNVAIEGGVRVPHVRVVDVALADGSLDVDVDVPGDYSVYTLRLLSIPGLDPRLSSVRFSFKVNCPTDFDCKPPDVCQPIAFRDPEIDYLARDYASFRQLMLERLTMLAPDWRERSPADSGVALVEILASAADHLSYFLDAVGTDAYLGTARHRISVRRHARLRDYFMHEGANARTFVTFEVDAGSSPTTLPRRTPLLTRVGSDQLVVSSALVPEALAGGALVFETMEALTAHRAHNRIPFHTWSDARCCLPSGATGCTLRGPLPDLVAGDLLLFEEVRGARTGAAADADPNRRHVVRLTQVEAAVDPLDGTPVVEIEWHEADALPFPLCLSSIDENGSAIDEVSIARGNVIPADHGRARVEHTLGFAGGGALRLPTEGPLTHAVPLARHHRDLPATDLARTDPAHALPQIRLFSGDRSWEARRDLLGSRDSDRHFVVEIEDDGGTRLRFGDNGHGMRPEAVTGFRAEYREGNGPRANIGAGAIGHLVDVPAGILSVRNPLAAWGGEAPESVERVRAFAPEAFKVQERAVTEEDYAEMAERHPEVQRAAATIRCTGTWSTVFLSIDRRGGRPVAADRDFVRSLLMHMDRYRMVGHDLEIRGPRFVPLDVVITVCVEPGHFRGEIQAELHQRLGSRLRADGRPAFFHTDLWTFGQSVYVSQIHAAVMSVPGVSSAEVTRLQRWGRAANKELSTGVLRIDGLEVARLDNDPNFHENGRLHLKMLGGR